MTENLTEKKPRVQFIDLAKGICICLIILYHINTAMIKGDFFFFNVTQIFRIPLYIILSGLFFKVYSGFPSFVVRKVNKLLIPFLFFYLTTSLLLPKLFYYLGSDVLYGSTVFGSSIFDFVFREFFQNVPIWFLLCLFEMNVIFYFLFEISNKYASKFKTESIVFCSLFLGALGYILFKARINLPCFIDSAFSLMPFFAFGYILKNKTSFLYPNRFDKYLFAFILLGVLVCLLIGGKVNYMHNFYRINYLYALIGGIFGSLMILSIAKIFKHIPVLSYIGRYSIIVLVTHHVYILLLRPVVSHVEVSNVLILGMCFIGVIILEIPTIFLFKKYLPYVTAQKAVFREW